MVASLVLMALLLEQVPAAGYARPDVELLNAAKLSELPRARELLASGASVNAADGRGFTPLMWAAAGGHLEMVRYLMASGAVLDRRARDGTTALMLASANGAVDVVRALLSRGVDVSAGRNGVTARQLAVSRGHAEIAALIQNAEDLGAQLLQAAGDGQGMLVRQLLARGAPCNITSEQGVSPLMLVARNGDLGTLQFLLSRGADGTARDQRGQTVFEWAEQSPATRAHVTAFLRDRGLQPIPQVQSGARQAPPIPASLRALEAALSKIPASTTAIRTQQRRAAGALSQLRALSAAWPAESPEDYRANLAAGVLALEAATGRTDAAVLRDSLQAIADDLEAKLEHCRKSGGKLGGSVLVRVRTIQGSQEAARWQVFYMAKILEAAASPTPDLFPQLSSPTEELLVPGRYVMWVRNPATLRVGERTVVKVGEGRKELLLDLPVPAP